ncbi:MAG: hypothetical protein ACRD3W_07360 [Terriglobales bacterium]
MSRSAWRIPGFLTTAVAAIVLVPLLCWAAKDFVMPEAQPAKTYAAHDEHPLEAVAVAVDPYDLAEKTNIFSVKYSEIDFLPIFVVVTNDGNQPIELAGMKAQLVTVNRAKLSPAGQEDIARRLTRPSANTNRYPIPFPTKKVKGGLSKQANEEIQNAQFEAKAVEPHSSQSGFLFFDVSGISVPLAGAHFYLTGVRDAKGNELMYFEIPLEKYLSAPSH